MIGGMVESGHSPDVGELRAYAESLRGTFMRMQAQASELHATARELQVTETSPDGMISATVGARGELVRLDLDPRLYRRPDARQLADSIVETVQRAAVKAQERVIEIFEPIIPGDQLKAHLDGDLETALDQLDDQLTWKE
ncbi:YbaB/EbfC family nucleoid-associated protein [Nonomuraea sp. NBC_01738]|uniref:YbaB/EbfC family nucleoid-associated protein n=1 Tax=Nonomuraea sp. NBC_01738 TaxID=2976003 RepID=UPI002E0D9779|nr:YbaB/EbfC family nucleoid-associated protein [Nonomuraea sp. NBC_01738]